YALRGWDLMLAYQHPALPHARATLSVYAAQFPGRSPDGFHDYAHGVTVKLQYFPREGARGWMAGVQIAFENQVYTYDMTGEHTDIDALIVGVIAGYRWVPTWAHGFFVYPWARFGYSQPVRGDRELVIGNHKMTVGWFSPVLTFHVGYELTF